MDELTIPFLGARRAAWQYPFGDLLRAGSPMAAGSDWSVSSPNPLEGIHVAVNRVAPGTDREPLYAQNRITLAEATTAYTAGSAFVNHLDGVTGRLEVGYLADLAVLDRDVFAFPTDEIADARVVATYVEGERVFSAT
jgi:predicted amidohydrolase YtcJ